MEGLHKLSAGFVFAFICLHMANHLIGLDNIETHLTFMTVARMIYRHPIVEMVLLMAFVAQMLTGWALAREIWARKKDLIHQFQAASGVYIAFFVITHVAFMLVGRSVLNLDTNIYYAIAGLMITPWKYVLIPYYGLAIMAIFLHMGCIIYDIFKKTAKPLAIILLIATIGLGGYVTWLMMATYGGYRIGIHVPPEYFEIYGGTL